MTSRPKHVSSLSDKIAGLKFMQRAKAVQDQHQQQSGPSSIAASSGALESKVLHKETIKIDQVKPEDINDEHWYLPSSSSLPIKQSTSSSSLISLEPGWNAWLSEADDVQASATAPGMSSRRSFGTWVKKSKKKETDSKKSEAPELEDEENYQSSSELDSDSNDEVIEGKRFIKPGSIKANSEKKVKGNGFTSGEKGRDKRTENDKRKKRPSKDGLTGFSSDKKSHKKSKKAKSH